MPFCFLILIGRIKTNVNRGPTFRFVNVIKYITVGYFYEIKKQSIKEHSNEVGGSNLLVHPAVTRNLQHVTTTDVPVPETSTFDNASNQNVFQRR